MFPQLQRSIPSVTLTREEIGMPIYSSAKESKIFLRRISFLEMRLMVSPIYLHKAGKIHLPFSNFL